MKWKFSLWAQGRYLNWKLRPRNFKSGTLIVDSPTLGWNIKYCWWTPDDIYEKSPFKNPLIVSRESMDEPDHPDRLETEFDFF